MVSKYTEKTNTLAAIKQECKQGFAVLHHWLHFRLGSEHDSADSSSLIVARKRAFKKNFGCFCFFFELTLSNGESTMPNLLTKFYSDYSVINPQVVSEKGKSLFLLNAVKKKFRR